MNPICKLYSVNEKELYHVQETLDSLTKNPVGIIEELGKHIFNAGGKKLRPLLTITCAKIFKDPIPKEAIYLAAAIECIHTATLVHDDVLDESKLRRGIPTANSLWGNTGSILVGDFLFSKAFELMVSCGDIEILKMLSQASAKICQGEVKQMVMTDNADALIKDYFDVIDLKTGTLFSSACRAGAQIGNASTNEIKAFDSYGLNLGRAFQVIDDILDYAGNEKTLGKKVGDDYYDGKMTLPVLELFNIKPEFKVLFLDEQKMNLKKIKHAMDEYKIFELCYAQAKIFSNQAIEALNEIKSCDLVEELKKIALYLDDRKS